MSVAALLKWYIFVPLLVIIYNVYQSFKIRKLMKKFGAKDFTNKVSDGFYGITRPFKMEKERKKGRYVEFYHSVLQNVDHPEIGTLTTKAVGIDIIFTKDPENIKAILATQFNDFEFGLRSAFLYPLLGEGIFTLDGEGWKHSRAMLRPQFSKEQVGHVQALEPHIQLLAKHIVQHNKNEFDIQELFFRFTVDTATAVLFGQSVESLKDSFIGFTDPEDNFDGRRDFANAFNKSQEYVAKRAMLNDLYFLINPQEFKESNAKVHRFADHYVNKALNVSSEELEKASKEQYIFLYELVKETRNPKVLRDQLLNILLAGRDTTASLLSFTFYELCRNKDIWKKLREEVDNKFGLGNESRVYEITFESLKRCEYLKAVLNESLRLYPTVPRNGRFANKNTTLPRGGGPLGEDPVLVRKGQPIAYVIYSTHRSSEFYGKDANEYRPERWFEPETRKLGWAYLPFNGGPRICLGQQFALTEASYVLVRLCQMFSSLDPPKDKGEYPPKQLLSISTCLYDPNLVSLY
ncbi:cytochrome P450 [Scheffersomyces amazonensis]|uniref:cytochrome P450 n=1 Tax=Scheffersomyces amazonensis TaxID=1078765 RepID=UPI00315CF714